MTAADDRLGLGVGLDLPWRGPYGIVDGRVADRTIRFLRRFADRFAYMFVSWQPPHRGTPRLADVAGPLDALFDTVPIAVRALHQTALNLGAARYDRAAIIALTNDLIARYGLAWVNEDLGLWSVGGRPLPYPQPPPLSDDGVAWCVRTCADVAARLDAPLVVEFPGFETPAPWLHGELDAYDAFRRIVEGADVRCNLDTGHLLTWRYLAGHRGEALLDELDRLPLEHCHEIHCAGTILSKGRMVDAHHGVLLDLQVQLAERLMARCPSLRGVTYEDPRFDRQGELPRSLRASLAVLEDATRRWMSGPPSAAARRERAPAPAVPADVGAAPWEDELAAQFSAPGEFGRRCRAQVLSRSGRGVGPIVDAYAAAIAAWCTAHGASHDALVLAFLDSAPGRRWSDFAWAVPGACIEDAFGCFIAPGSHEHRIACARVLAVDPDPPFAIPTGFTRAPRGWFAIGDTDGGPRLYAALDGRLVTGAITPLICALLRGDRPAGSDAAHQRLVGLGLVD